MVQMTLFDDSPNRERKVVKSGLCNLCKGTKALCGRDRCPLMLKFYSQQKYLPQIDRKEVEGCSPPAVFVGRNGYPKVEIGPLLPSEFGDTSLLDSPERWVGMGMDQIAEMRFRLVRGKHRIDARDFRKAGRIVDSVQELALTEKPIEVETRFDKKPTGRMVLDDAVQPFGPSGRMEGLSVGNGRFERNLEKSFYDTDLRSTEAVINSYRNGTLVSEIQKAFSVGTMGIDKNRRFVPTRWSITAVDDIISKNLASGIRFNETIGDYRVYFWDQLDNRWAIIMMPVSWRYEMIEAWWPKSSWNQFDNQVIMEGDHEFFDGIGHYAKITGSYYAARLAVTEKLEAEGRSAGVIVLREIHPGYDIPLGVWNIRENCRAALKYEPIRSDTLEGLWPHVDAFLELNHSRWKAHSAILKDFLTQRRIDDYY